ncbi:MAG: histidine--tRNA ligase [Nocardioidaceae bacterium]
MSRPTPLSGFPELLPAQRAGERAVIDQLAEVFELHGFANIETRAVEPLDQLLRNGEIDKEFYVLRRLHADTDASDAGVGLHYDLTVPFARYVLENAGRLEFPFRRYQIQRAWRGERPQEGRFREFTQADIAIVARDHLAFPHDVEVARVTAEALDGMPLPQMRLQVNNRKLIEGFYRGLGVDDPGAVMRVIDKLDKLSTSAVTDQLTGLGLTLDQAGSCLSLADIRTADSGFVDEVRALGVHHDLLDVGIEELAQVIAGCAPFGNDRLTIEADLRIARGLDYYTGTVFETVMSGFESLGSICSGGRYDALAVDGSTTYPGVGISFGVSRTLLPLFQRDLLSGPRSVPSVVLVALVDEESRDASEIVAGQLRSRGIPVEVAGAAQKYGKQIRSAQRRGIPFVWFPPADVDAKGGDTPHQVKDIRSGEQLDADPASWQPPSVDLRPRVTFKEPAT